MKFKLFLEKELQGVIPHGVPLPAGYYRLGHVVLVALKPDALRYANEIGHAILQYCKGARTVAIKTGPTAGITRQPSYRVVAGNPCTNTTHIENGVKFRLDPLQLTFSRGNKGERMKMAAEVDASETVIDMFACVGQFTIPIAKIAGAQVVALEINPVAYEFLKENIELNGVTDRVRSILGDCRKTIPSRTADRIIMGYLHNTVAFLPAALTGLKPNGGLIHMHALVHDEDCSETHNTIKIVSKEHGYSTTIVHRRIKKYSPRMDHYCFDIYARPSQ